MVCASSSINCSLICSSTSLPYEIRILSPSSSKKLLLFAFISVFRLTTSTTPTTSTTLATCTTCAMDYFRKCPKGLQGVRKVCPDPCLRVLRPLAPFARVFDFLSKCGVVGVLTKFGVFWGKVHVGFWEKVHGGFSEIWGFSENPQK